MIEKFLEAQADSEAATAYYYDNVSAYYKAFGFSAERARAAMEAAWRFVERLRLLIALRSVENEYAEPQSFKTLPCLDFLWATKCMTKERWRYTPTGLRTWRQSLG